MKQVANKETIGKWICAESTDTETWQACEHFNTKEEAIRAGRLAVQKAKEGQTYISELKMFVEDVLGCYPVISLTSFAVGRIVPATLSIDVGVLLEHASDALYEEVGDQAEDFCLNEDIPSDKQEELSDIIRDWLIKNGYNTEFTKLEDIEKIPVEEPQFLVGVRVDVKLNTERKEDSDRAVTEVRVLTVHEKDLKITEKQVENRSGNPDFLFKTCVFKKDLDKPMWAYSENNVTQMTLVKASKVEDTVNQLKTELIDALSENYEYKIGLLNAQLSSLKKSTVN